MKTHRLAFIDIETTGLDPDRHEIIEIGCVLMDQVWHPDGRVELVHIEECEYKVKPERIADADPQALRVNGYNAADWIFAYTLPEAMKMLGEKTRDCIFVAHNACFDYMFIDKAFRLTGIENKMHYHKIDTISVAFARLGHGGDIDRFSLRALCEFFKIENKNAHTALADTRAMALMYEKMMNYKRS